MRYEPLTRHDVEELHDMLARIDTNPGLSQVVGRITATLVDLQQQVDELRARLDSIDDEGESKP